MPARYPIIKYFRNDVDITSILSPYVIRITLEDIFDTTFTVSKLEIEIDSRFNPPWSWEYKNMLKIEAYYSNFPNDKLTTNYYYVDYIVDNKQNNGQSYVINSIDADLSLGFKYGESVTITNRYIRQAIDDIRILFNLTVQENMAYNVMVGTIPIPDPYTGGSLPNENVASKTFKSYAEVMQWICTTYGYFGNISGRLLQIYKINLAQTFESDFSVPTIENITSFGSKNQYTQLYKTYKSFYVERANTNTLTEFNVNNSFNITEKILNMRDEGAYYNVESGTERAYGRMYQDYINAFSVELKSVGFPSYRSGKKFYLGESYKQYSGYYRTTKVVHDFSANAGWNATITAIPLEVFYRATTEFKSQYTTTVSSTNDIVISRKIVRTNTINITSTQLDNFARSLNSAYNVNLGSIFISEGATENICSELAFCQFLVESNNYKNPEVINKYNSGGISDTGGSTNATFTSWNVGIRAHIQHLFAYATDTGSPVNPIVDPRYNFVTRGIAKTTTQLSGRWYASQTYGQAIDEKMVSLYKFLGYRSPGLKD